jgi:uncharacterized protein
MTSVIYLHGFASSPASTKARAFERSLTDAGFAVQVPDLAQGRFEQLTVTDQLAVIERAAGGGPISLIGSSLGGYLAALFAARHPEVERVVLMVPAFAFARRWQDWLGAEAIAQWRATGHREFFHYGENRPLNLGYQLLADAQRYEDYPEVHQPTLIFHGANDSDVPPDVSHEFARRHSNARLEILDSDHQLTDQIDYMATEIRKFLR